MPDSNIPKWFWIIGAFALIWNLLSLLTFFSDVVTMTPERLAEMDEPMRLAYENAPQWANISNGVFVFFGTLGSIFLLLKKKLALPLFVISFLAICVMLVDVFFVGKYYEVFGSAYIIMPAMILGVAALLIWYSKKSIAKNWLK